ncbi:MAG: hypothetical protein WC895_05140, partial [Candidatus Shapirobacteria bacterium]
MAAIPPIEGFLFKSIPRSPIEAASQAAIGMVLDVTKSAVQWYIKSFIDGAYKQILGLAAPYTIEWTAESLDQNSQMRQIQLARIWSGLKASIPQILIGDTGAKNLSTGYFPTATAYPLASGEQAQQVGLHMSVDLAIHLASTDETTFDQLFTTLNLIFGSLANLGPGRIITPAVINVGQAQAGRVVGQWEVRLALTF